LEMAGGRVVVANGERKKKPRGLERQQNQRKKRQRTREGTRESVHGRRGVRGTV